MVAANKQRTLNKTLTQLSTLYSDAVPEGLSVLDHLLLGLLQEGSSFSRAVATHQRMRERFFDLNELRVSHRDEVVPVVAGLADPPIKARRIIDILQYVFETTYSFDLEPMRKKPLKQALKQISNITGSTDFAVAAVVQRSLGGHAIPVDEEMKAVLTRLDLVGEADDLATCRSSLENLVPKTKGVSFCILVGELAADAERREEILQGLAPSSRRKSSSPSRNGVKTEE